MKAASVCSLFLNYIIYYCYLLYSYIIYEPYSEWTVSCSQREFLGALHSIAINDTEVLLFPLTVAHEFRHLDQALHSYVAMHTARSVLPSSRSKSLTRTGLAYAGPGCSFSAGASQLSRPIGAIFLCGAGPPHLRNFLR